MIGGRFEIEGILEVLTPLMIGSGNREPVENSEDAPMLATVMKDHSGRPYVPGSSLKGVLRRHGGDEALFGPAVIDAEQHGWSGDAIFWDAFQVGNDASLKRQSRTSIEEESGTADTGRLFVEEFVMPGTKFRMEIFLPEGSKSETALKELLGRISAPEGVRLGSDTRQDLGRVRLDPQSLKVGLRRPGKERQRVKWDLRKVSTEDTLIWRRLSCAGPFLIADAERAKERSSGEGPQLLAILDPDGGPRLTGSTLLGALRAAFEWQAAGETGPEITDWLRERAATPTDRLFGTTRWRGLVEIARLDRIGMPRRQSIPSVKLDRFSGAPMDNALFFTEGWVGSEFDVGFRIADRTPPDPSDKAILEQDAARFDAFLASLEDDVWGGLQLGHGANRGYGWFAVSRVDRKERAA